MKIAIITDTHFGIRNDAEVFYNSFDNFYTNKFFPTLEKEKVEWVFHLGDLYDRRRYINFRTAHEAEKSFLNPLQERYGKNVIILSGNHDIYYRDVNNINALDILLEKYDFNVLHDPIEMKFGSSNILFLPWICESNKDRSMKLIENSTCPIAMGHLEVANYEMYAGVAQDHGMDVELFKNFQAVYSGHYHHKSTKKNVTYLGAACEYTWSDYNDARGFHIFDTETQKMKFYRNPYNMFVMLNYDDSKDWEGDFKQVADKYVKILVYNKTDPVKFENFIANVYEQKPIDVTVIEDNILSTIEEQGSEDFDESKATPDLIIETVDSLNTSLSKKELKNYMLEMYNEAVAMGVET